MRPEGDRVNGGSLVEAGGLENRTGGKSPPACDPPNIHHLPGFRRSHNPPKYAFLSLSAGLKPRGYNGSRLPCRLTKEARSQKASWEPVRELRKPSLPRKRESIGSRKSWIPAFAGMTNGR